jgi:hypothetical protein
LVVEEEVEVECAWAPSFVSFAAGLDFDSAEFGEELGGGE